MKRLFAVATLLALLPCIARAADSQFYPPPAPGGENGYWVPYSASFSAGSYTQGAYDQPWVDAPIKIEAIVANCDHASIVLHWANDASMVRKGQIPVTTGGDYPVPIGLANYDLSLFARHGFSFVSPASIDPKIGQCVYFVSGLRWVPASSASAK